MNQVNPQIAMSVPYLMRIISRLYSNNLFPFQGLTMPVSLEGLTSSMEHEKDIKPSVLLFEQLSETQPVWFLATLDRNGATDLLKNREDGVSAPEQIILIYFVVLSNRVGFKFP